MIEKKTNTGIIGAIFLLFLLIFNLGLKIILYIIGITENIFAITIDYTKIITFREMFFFLLIFVCAIVLILKLRYLIIRVLAFFPLFYILSLFALVADVIFKKYPYNVSQTIFSSIDLIIPILAYIILFLLALFSVLKVAPALKKICGYLCFVPAVLIFFIGLINTISYGIALIDILQYDYHYAPITLLVFLLNLLTYLAKFIEAIAVLFIGIWVTHPLKIVKADNFEATTLESNVSLI